MLINLNRKWSFREASSDKWYDANVPGCNYLDLLDNNLIEDPFYGLNEKKVAFVGDNDYEYKRTFVLTKKDLEKELIIYFESLDTIADIYLNNIKIGSTKNAHIEHNFDITTHVVEGENELRIYFYSPVKYVNEKQKICPIPRNSVASTSRTHIRKPQYHFDWDWGPYLPPSGISGNAYIKEKRAANILDAHIKQSHDEGKVTLNVEVETDFNESLKGASLELKVLSPDGESKTLIKPLDTHITFEMEISNPKLWWTAELSNKQKQPLYTISVSIKTDEATIDIVEKKIGLRTIVLNQAKDEYGRNFQFVLNGVPIFAKGANWIPADSFITRVTKDKLEWYIQTAVKSNFNIIRVWGGGFYASEDFYDLCDKYGILVWQDFMYACHPYPFFFEDFTDNAIAEAGAIIKRIRHRASLALLCGNNEIELLSLAWIDKREFIKWTEIFFYQKLHDVISKLCPYISYIPSSPIGHKYNKGTSADNVGNTHLWAVWHGLQPMTYYRKRLTRFCSEFGFESLPDIKTINSFATEKDFSLTSEVFNSHQKCPSGNMRIAYYIASRFRLPKDFLDYIYLSNICQLECIQDATEHWRRNKGRCNGSIFWQFNDCWPVVSWSSVDYYGNYKALQYGAKNFFAPQMISIENEKKYLDIYIVNDLLTNLNAKVKYALYDFDGNMLFEEEEANMVPANASIKVKKFWLEKFKKFNLSKCVFVAELYENDKLLSRKTCLFKKEKDLNLPKANISISVSIEKDIATYTLTTNKFARLTCISSKTNTNPFSDNYFDLIPGETKVISQKLDKTYTIEELLKETSITSVSDIKPKNSKLGDLIVRGKVFLRPVNFFSWMYYNTMSTEVNLEE
jgi:beta-mannosidase